MAISVLPQHISRDRLTRMAERRLTRADKVALGIRERTPADYRKMAKATGKKARKQQRRLEER